MRKSFYVSLFVILSGSLAAQTKNARSWNGSKIVFEGQPASIRLAPHVTTTIRLPEPVNSVIVGDPTLFQAEYSPNESLLVFAKAATTSVAETNLVISTVRGRQFVLLLKSLSAPGDQTESIAWVSRQVQLAGLSKPGIFHRSRWTTVQQIPVQAFQISQRRLGPGDRADGVVLFERPATKQSTEGLFLQIADSAAIDQPVLAPINFR